MVSSRSCLAAAELVPKVFPNLNAASSAFAQGLSIWFKVSGITITIFLTPLNILVSPLSPALIFPKTPWLFSSSLFASVYSFLSFTAVSSILPWSPTRLPDSSLICFNFPIRISSSSALNLPISSSLLIGMLSAIT